MKPTTDNSTNAQQPNPPSADQQQPNPPQPDPAGEKTQLPPIVNWFAATADRLFAVYQLETGSLTLGDVRLIPLVPIVVSEELALRVDEEENPVRFFKSLDRAEENVAKLRAKFEAQRKPKDA